MRGGSRERERERWQEEERDRGRGKPNKPGAMSPVSASEEGEKRGGEPVCVCVCVHKKETTHPPKGWGHSQIAAEVQQSCRPCRSTLFCLPYTQNTHASKHKNNAPKLSHTHAENTVRRVNRNSAKPCKRAGLRTGVDLKGWERVNPTMTASGEAASSRTCTHLSLCV